MRKYQNNRCKNSNEWYNKEAERLSRSGKISFRQRAIQSFAQVEQQEFIMISSLFCEETPNAIQNLYQIVASYFDAIVEFFILIVECIGIVVLLYSVIGAVVRLCRREEHVRLRLAEGIALSLEFKMGGELLRTVIVREWNELLILGAIILLRAALTFLIQWEIKVERKSDNLPEPHSTQTPTQANAETEPLSAKDDNSPK